MRDARSEVSCRIDGVSCRPTQRQANAPDQAAHKIRAESCHGSSLRNALRENGANHENKREVGNDFAPPIRSGIADTRCTTKATQLRRSVRRCLPMRKVMEPDE